jgi:hypothetical protein
MCAGRTRAESASLPAIGSLERRERTSSDPSHRHRRTRGRMRWLSRLNDHGFAQGPSVPRGCLGFEPPSHGCGCSRCTRRGDGSGGLDDCDRGAICWHVDPETMEGSCLAFCSGTPEDPICTAGSSCVIRNDGVLSLCEPLCDPLLQDCDAPQACWPNPFDQGFFCESVPAEAGYGEPCDSSWTCAPGLFCAGTREVPDCAGEVGCCSPFCDLDQPDPCPGAGQVCMPWFAPGEAPAGFDHIGGCRAP